METDHTVKETIQGEIITFEGNDSSVKIAGKAEQGKKMNKTMMKISRKKPKKMRSEEHKSELQSRQ